MIAFVLSASDLAIKDALTFEKYEFKHDIDYAQKSFIEVVKRPNVDANDFVICRDDNETVFSGICEKYASKDGANYTITLLQAEKILDRFIFVGNESLISSAGIEDFIASEIRANWVNSNDPLMDRNYFSIRTLTHTPVSAKVSTIGSVENGIYNLKTFAGNAKEYYKIMISVDVGLQNTLITDGGIDIVTDFGIMIAVHDGENRHGLLHVDIYADSSPVAPLDVTVSEIADYSETYSVDVVAKALVAWEKPDETVAYRNYYLRENKTITTDINDPERVYGGVRSYHIKADTEAELYTEVVNIFAANKYEHKITLSLMNGSKAYTAGDYYVGRTARIKTKSGIRETLVTATTETSEKPFTRIDFGKLKITLIDKIRGANE